MAKKQKLTPPKSRGKGDPLGRGGPTAAEARRVMGGRVENPYGNGIDGVVVVADTVALLAGRGKLTPGQLAAAERYRRAADVAASLGDCVLGKDGGTAGIGAAASLSEARLMAAADLNTAGRALGPLHWVVHSVCVEGWTLGEVAARLGTAAGEKVSSEARAGASALLKAGLDALAQRWFRADATGMRTVRASDARGEFFAEGRTSTISAGVAVHCTIHRVFVGGEAR